MKKIFRLVVFIMCMAWLLSLFGCDKGYPVDGPGMEREVWSEFTLSRCSEIFEPIYSYTVNYDETLHEAHLYIKVYESQTIEKSIKLEARTVSELFNLNMMSLPDAEALTGTLAGLSVTDQNGQVVSKHLSSEKEKEILSILAPYFEELEAEEEYPFMLDGPDMVYKPLWTEFTLSGAGSLAQYHFWFTVSDTEGAPVVSGACRDDNGVSYEEDTGIPISEDALWQLRQMNLEQLPDLNESNEIPEELEAIMDDNEIELSVTLEDGTVLQKKASGELSMEIYKLLLPYFQNNQQ